MASMWQAGGCMIGWQGSTVFCRSCNCTSVAWFEPHSSRAVGRRWRYSSGLVGSCIFLDLFLIFFLELQWFEDQKRNRSNLMLQSFVTPPDRLKSTTAPPYRGGRGYFFFLKINPPGGTSTISWGIFVFSPPFFLMLPAQKSGGGIPQVVRYVASLRTSRWVCMKCGVWSVPGRFPHFFGLKCLARCFERFSVVLDDSTGPGSVCEARWRRPSYFCLGCLPASMPQCSVVAHYRDLGGLLVL